MEKEIIDLLKLLLPGTPFAVLLLVLVLFFPEKIEKWSALLWRVLASMGSFFRGAHKRYVKHDLQGRVNSFVRRLRDQVPPLGTERIEIQWVDPSTDRTAFLRDGRLVLRLRRDDPTEHNFIHGAFLFISGSLLRHAKRYLSQPQREALDLFVCARLLEQEKPSAHEVFLDEYLHPKTVDRKSKTALLIDDFAIIDQGNLFFPVLLQELHFLGNKVFGRRRDDLITSEVNGLVTFLRPIAVRKVGDEGDLNFEGSYCRFGLVIIGKPSKLLVSTQPYLTYIRKRLVARGAETIYLFARRENERKLEEICSEFVGDYECVRRMKAVGPIRYSRGTQLVDQCLYVLRRNALRVIDPSVRSDDSDACGSPAGTRSGSPP